MLGFLKTTTFEEQLKKLGQPRKLSDLILEGCKLAPKAEGNYANEYGTCALGAAYHAKFGYKEYEGDTVLAGLDLYRHSVLVGFIVLGNDRLSMPRELIAYTLKVFGK